ncbi:MAG: c-type cytochrome [Burkholderiales bacterium]|nr:c-type cytochrome [Burkholderiales bacterium]MDE1929333.1 c-type cytochrome [Burkholderiales bacterium]MDE2159104.1 c-type cytochrome [Burkholderiales bacterium]MDE2504834.1 c-type cytochrome [Burkholderiales bacterium]
MPRISPQDFVPVRDGMRGHASARGSARLRRRLVGALCGLLLAGAAAADPSAVRHGAYLVAIGGCTDCHTPGHLRGRPDPRRYLGGSDVGFAVPQRGVFVGPNLTPDDQTGLGRWTMQQIATAITTGKRPDGRQLAPVMPYAALARLTPADALAIAAYLKSLAPVHHQVAGPFGPHDRPTTFVLTVLPAGTYNALPQPAGP